jgi:hypothetical protein
MDKETILVSLHHFNEKYNGTGFELAALFGSFARGTQDLYSDVDIAYKINHDLFYKDDAFAKLNKIQEIKKELEENLHKKVDLIPLNTTNQQIQKTLQNEAIAI